MDKAELRRIGLNGRNGVRGERRKRYDHAIAEALVRSEAFLTARIVMAYCRAGGEVDVAEAVERALQSGKTVVYPYCTGRTSMEALQPEDDGAWQTDRNGMRAPIPVALAARGSGGHRPRAGALHRVRRRRQPRGHGRRLLRPVPAALPARANDARGL